MPDMSDDSRIIYIPIADTFFTSSIMREPIPVRFVMLALIREAMRPGANGIVDVDPVIFAQAINVPYPEFEAALKRLMEPDPASSGPDEDGRRIVPVNPERPMRRWRLVNWGRYKDIVHRAHDAARKREKRAHEKEYSTDYEDTSENVQKRPYASENGATKTKTKTKTINEDEEEGVGVAASPEAAPSTPTGFSFEVAGGTNPWNVPWDLLEDLKGLYPSVDVEAEIQRAVVKIRNGAVSKKTARGMPRFLHSWMETEQNNPRHRVRTDHPAPATRDHYTGLTHDFKPQEGRGKYSDAITDEELKGEESPFRRKP